jgi:hypothetical protein
MTTAWGAGAWGSNSWGGQQSELSGVAASGGVGTVTAEVIYAVAITGVAAT